MKPIIESILSIIIILLILCGSFISGYFYHAKNMPEKITIKEVTKTEYKYIAVKNPITLDDYKAAYLSPIEIRGKVDNNWLNVTATDGYKQSDKGFKIFASGNWNYAIYAGLAGVVIGGGIVLWSK